jgi:biopolymer transport protein ExbD
MRVCRFCVFGSIVLFGLSVSARSSEPSAPLVISEGTYIGYATVADALAALKARGVMEVSSHNGYVSYLELDNGTTWTFTEKGRPAHPAAVKYVYTRSGSVLNVEITVLCEAAEAPCEEFRSQIRDNVAIFAKMMADPAFKCRVHGDETKTTCGVEPVRNQTDQKIYVQLQEDGTCAVDSVVTPCLDVGKKIRAQHLTDDPKVNVCARANAKFDAVGDVINALNDEYLPLAFGCPPH